MSVGPVFDLLFLFLFYQFVVVMPCLSFVHGRTATIDKHICVFGCIVELSVVVYFVSCPPHERMRTPTTKNTRRMSYTGAFPGGPGMSWVSDTKWFKTGCPTWFHTFLFDQLRNCSSRYLTAYAELQTNGVLCHFVKRAFADLGGWFYDVSCFVMLCWTKHNNQNKSQQARRLSHRWKPFVLSQSQSNVGIKFETNISRKRC